MSNRGMTPRFVAFVAFALLCGGASCAADPTGKAPGGANAETPISFAGMPATTTVPTAGSTSTTPQTPGLGNAGTPSNGVPTMPTSAPPVVATAGVAAPATAGTGAMPAEPTHNGGKPLAMNECGLETNYDGDEYCILPPPPDQGFQLHIGPTNYENPEAQYVLRAGQELTTDFRATSTNDKKIFFYYRQFRQRPGAHHNIITTTAGLGGGLGMGRRIGTSNHLTEDSPAGGLIAPENEGVGIPLEANSPINVSLHSINTTEKPQLREVWINFWYRDPAKVTDPAEEMFQIGNASFAVPPHADQMLGPYRCNVAGQGRMLWFYGHRHANNVRFSAWRIRGQQRDLFYEAYNWEEPLVLEYSSTVTNAKVDRDKGIEGGWSGILDFNAGDVIEWECHVINKTDQTLRFANETYTAEMCIMDAELVGANCQ